MRVHTCMPLPDSQTLCVSASVACLGPTSLSTQVAAPPSCPPPFLAHTHRQLQWIMQDAEKNLPSHEEAQIATMTSANRNEWADFRDTYMADGVTRASLEAIERAVRCRNA